MKTHKQRVSVIIVYDDQAYQWIFYESPSFLVEINRLQQQAANHTLRKATFKVLASSSSEGRPRLKTKALIAWISLSQEATSRLAASAVSLLMMMTYD
jgi:hypothetical protein